MLMLVMAIAGAGMGPEARIPWITTMDYPAALEAQRAEGVVEFALRYDDAGRVTDCAIVKSSGTVLLDVVTCRIAHRRARARPDEPRAQAFRHRWVAPAAR